MHYVTHANSVTYAFTKALSIRPEKKSMPPFLIFTIYFIDSTIEISLVHSTYVLIVIIDSFQTAKSFF